MCTLIRFLRFMGMSIFLFLFLNPSLLLSWIFEHDCVDTLYWVSFVFHIYVFALVQRSWACFTWKGTVEIQSLLLLFNYYYYYYYYLTAGEAAWWAEGGQRETDSRQGSRTAWAGLPSGRNAEARHSDGGDEEGGILIVIVTVVIIIVVNNISDFVMFVFDLHQSYHHFLSLLTLSSEVSSLSPFHALVWLWVRPGPTLCTTLLFGLAMR